MVTALKPVRAEQVRRPKWKENWTVPHCASVLPICISLRPVGSIHISCLAAREQTSAAQIAKASPPYNMKYFIFLALSFNSIFFWLKRPSTSACTVVPLTTPLIHQFLNLVTALEMFLTHWTTCIHVTHSWIYWRRKVWICRVSMQYSEAAKKVMKVLGMVHIQFKDLDGVSFILFIKPHMWNLHFKLGHLI